MYKIIRRTPGHELGEALPALHTQLLGSQSVQTLVALDAADEPQAHVGGDVGEQAWGGNMHFFILNFFYTFLFQYSVFYIATFFFLFLNIHFFVILTKKITCYMSF